MGKISTSQINAAYDLARQVQSAKSTEDAAICSLERDHGMNATSATIYVRNLGLMLEGKILKRTMSAPSFAIYLDRISEDYGCQVLARALKSTRAHVDYYGSLGRGNLRRVGEICDLMQARLA
jgi:5-methylcytosine-specific restriction enzyme A